MKRSLVLTIFAAVMLLASVSNLYADVPQMINYQARLTDDQGDPVTATVSITFAIYDQESGGTVWWTETQTGIQVSNGLFSAMLGTIEPIDDSVFVDPDRYLGIAVDGDPEIVPRTKLITVPYVYRVSTVDGASGGFITSKLAIGEGCTNSGNHAFAAGRFCEASGSHSTVGGGYNNEASWQNCTVAGGNSNTASGEGSSVLGGELNTASGGYSVVAGGGGEDEEAGNVASGTISCVSGGSGNLASGMASCVSGGSGNTAIGDYSTVGGVGNNASGDWSTVSGGSDNTASGSLSTVPGGYSNLATGYSSFAAGFYTTASGFYSFALGQQAKAVHDGAFVWADHSSADFTSTASDQFLIRAAGGVGIGTTSPNGPMHVQSTMSIANSSHYDNREAPLVIGDGDGTGVCLLLDGNQIESDADRLNINTTSPDDVVMVVGGGDVGIGTSSPSQKLHVAGNICYTGNIGACSDGRYKKNIEQINTALETITRLRGVTYNWKQDEYPNQKFDDQTHLGFIAQEVRELLPEVILEDDNGYLSVDYSRLTPLLVEAVKEQQQQIEKLTALVEHLLEMNKTETDVHTQDK